MPTPAPTRTAPTRGAAPSLKGFPLVGVLPRFRRDPLRLFQEAARQHGDFVHMRFGPTDAYLLNHPDLIQHVLQTNNRNYRRESYGNNVLKLVTGLNLLTSDGEYWLQQRRLMQPAFHRAQIAGFGDLMVAATRRLLEGWQVKAAAGSPIDVHEEMMRLTLEIVGRALFSVDLSGEASELGQAFTEAIEYVNYRLNHLVYVPLVLPSPRNLRLRQAMETIDKVIYDMIDRRQRSGEIKDDLLSMLLAARYEDSGQGMTAEQLRHEVGIMMGAGHETTANTLTWAFYLLSENPEAEEALHHEVDTVLAGRPASIEDLGALPYTRMVIEESMRLYPPAWVLAGRQAIETDRINGYTLPAGSIAFISPYVIHRDPRFWPQPEHFNPARFSAEASAERPRFAYLPFGDGPRKCIGQDFARVEALLALATIAQGVSLRLMPGTRVKPDPIFTLRVRGGLPMTLHPRRPPAGAP